MVVLSNPKTLHLSLRSSFKRPLGGAKLTNRVEVNLVVVVVVSICCVCGCLVVVGLTVVGICCGYLFHLWVKIEWVCDELVVEIALGLQWRL